MPLILVRYAEIGLKSRPVRRRFESMLKDNITDMLMRDGVESIISTDEGRLYVECADPAPALTSLRRVFGVASVSETEVIEGGMEEICSAAAEYSQGVMSEGQSFAVRPRREGVHDFTSVDLGREVGSAIFIANEHLSPRVDLKQPDVEFFVEVRQRKAYLFREYLPGPGGLPLGSQGKVVAFVESAEDSLAAWLMMRRGCRALIKGEDPTGILERYDPRLRTFRGEMEDILRSGDIMGTVHGYTLDDMQSIHESYVPGTASFYPLIGFSKEDIRKMFAGML